MAVGGVVPGDHPGAHRGRHRGSFRRPPRAEGEHHHRQAHPRRHRQDGLPVGAHGGARPTSRWPSTRPRTRPTSSTSPTGWPAGPTSVGGRRRLRPTSSPSPPRPSSSNARRSGGRSATGTRRDPPPVRASGAGWRRCRPAPDVALRRRSTPPTPGRLAEFYRRSWATSTGRATRRRRTTTTGWCCSTRRGQARLAFQQVDSLPASTWPSDGVPQQLHLDLSGADRRRAGGPARAGAGARGSGAARPVRRPGRAALRLRRPRRPPVLHLRGPCVTSARPRPPTYWSVGWVRAPCRRLHRRARTGGRPAARTPPGRGQGVVPRTRSCRGAWAGTSTRTTPGPRRTRRWCWRPRCAAPCSSTC